MAHAVARGPLLQRGEGIRHDQAGPFGMGALADCGGGPLREGGGYKVVCVEIRAFQSNKHRTGLNGAGVRGHTGHGHVAVDARIALQPIREFVEGVAPAHQFRASSADAATSRSSKWIVLSARIW